jgi:citrate lyase beta subunit
MLTQIERVNQVYSVSTESVEAARESMVIRHI